MALTTILEETTVSGFADAGDGSTYYAILSTPSSVFIAGETYLIYWDGTEHELMAFDNEGSVMVAYESESGEGFAIVNMEDAGDYGLQIMTNSTDTSHTLAICQVTAEEVGIITRDYKGDVTEHYGLETLEVDTTDGGTQKFVREDLVPVVEDLAVDLDFSGGDMVINPGAGKAFGGVTIPVPAGLSVENIPSGMFIAGIGPGTLVAGGGNSELISKTDVFTPSAASAEYTVTHDLGVVPDIVAVMASGATITTTNILTGAFGVRAALVNRGGQGLVGSTLGSIGIIMGIEKTDSNARRYGAVRDATESTFTVGGSSWKLGAGITYAWVAIGGLT